MWQGDPVGELLFALAIQPVLESAAALHDDCSIVAYADDITLHGPQHAVEYVFCPHCDALTPVRLHVNPAITKVFCADAAVAAETAANIGCTDETLTVVAGTPIGEPERVQQHVHSCVAATEACIEMLLGLPLSPQEKFLLMHGSLQRHEDHLTWVVPWSLLQEPLQKLEGKLVAVVKAIAELSDADRSERCFMSPTAMGGLAFNGLTRMLLMHLSWPLQYWPTMQWSGAHSASDPLPISAPPPCELRGSVFVSGNLR